MLRHTWLVTIAGILALVGLVTAAFYYASQPTTLKVAVGPPNSEDVRVIQTIAQHLGRERGSVRLRILVKDGRCKAPPPSIRARPISRSSGATGPCRKTGKPWPSCGATSS